MVLVVASILLAGAGFATPVAAQDEACTSTATGTSAGTGVSFVDVDQTSFQLGIQNNVQTGTAVSVGGDATVAISSQQNLGQGIVQEACDG